MAVTPLHVWGWSQEIEMQPILESYVGEKLQKTSARYDIIDFEGPTCYVELKCRKAKDKNGYTVTSKTHDSWLMPASKIEYADRQEKRVFLFYRFEADKTLWVIDYKRGMLADLQTVRPIWHSARSLHYYIPADRWTRLEVVTEDVVVE